MNCCKKLRLQPFQKKTVAKSSPPLVNNTNFEDTASLAKRISQENDESLSDTGQENSSVYDHEETAATLLDEKEKLAACVSAW